MTSLDALTHDAGAHVRRGRTRDLGGPIVLHLFRLLKLAQMHSLDNQAIKAQLEATAAAFHDYRLRSGESVVLFFARGVIFFVGEPLKAPRATYEAGIELGEMMQRCGGSELSFAPDISAADLRTFTVAVTRTLREPMTKFSDFDVPRVRLRSVSDAAQLRGLEIEALDDEQRVVRTYASAVVVMRRFFEDLLRADAVMPRRIKRIAQALVDLSAGRTPALLGVTAVRNANHDEAGRAVNSAILAVAMARQLTDDRVPLTRVAMAALLLDAGRPRALRALRSDDSDAPLPASLPDDADRALPAGAAAVLTALGRVNEPTIIRSVVAYEALWQRRLPLLGALYRGLRPPTLHARIVAVARAYNDLLTPRPAEPPLSPADALLRLEEEIGTSKDRADKTVLRLLMAAVGLLPPGTLVQLSSGASAVVVFGDASGLRLRILLEADGALPDAPRELSPGDDGVEIARITGTDPAFSKRPAGVGPLPRPLSGNTGEGGPPPSMRPGPPPSMRSGPPASVRPEDPASVPPGTLASAQPASARASRRPPAAAPASQRGSGLDSPPSTPPPASRRPPAPEEEDRTTIWTGPASRPLIATIRSTPPPPPVAEAPPPLPDEPTFSGDLQRSPVPHILTNLLGRSLSGSLRLAEPSGAEHTLVFESGALRKLHSFAAARRLGEILVEQGLIDAGRVEEAVKRASARRLPLGKQLVADGALSSRDVVAAIAEQMSERVASLASLPRDTSYAFYQDHDALPGALPVTMEPLALVYASMRALDDPRRMDETLSRLGTTPLALHPSAAVERFQLSEDESALLRQVLDFRLSYPEARDASGDEAAALRVLIYTLAITRHLDLGASHWPFGVPRTTEVSVISTATPVSTSARLSMPPSAITLAPGSFTPPPASVRRIVASPLPAGSAEAEGGPPASVRDRPSVPPASIRDRASSLPAPISDRPSTPPTSERPSLPPTSEPSLPPTTLPAGKDQWAERRARILERLSSIEGQNHYEALSLARDATAPEIQKAFLDAAKQFHPDKLPEPLADLREQSARVFAAVVEAHKTLADPQARAAYDATLDSGISLAAEQAEVERVLQASVSFQKAEILLRRNDLDGAEPLARAAVEQAPQPEHLALMGWVHAQRGRLPEALNMLDQAIRGSPEADLFYFYRGSVRKRLGHNREAHADFKRAIEINPRNIDAMREVRLHEMRNKSEGNPRSGPRPDENKGLFSKLFGKKNS